MKKEVEEKNLGVGGVEEVGFKKRLRKYVGNVEKER